MSKREESDGVADYEAEGLACSGMTDAAFVWQRAMFNAQCLMAEGHWRDALPQAVSACETANQMASSGMGRAGGWTKKLSASKALLTVIVRRLREPSDQGQKVAARRFSVLATGAGRTLH